MLTSEEIEKLRKLAALRGNVETNNNESLNNKINMFKK